MTEKTYMDGIQETFKFCIEKLSTLLKSLELTGQNKTKVYVTLTNVRKNFEFERDICLEGLEQQMPYEEQ